MEFSALLRKVGANVRSARWAKGMTQEQVAAQGFTYRYYQELERGACNPTLRTLHNVAGVLDTTIAALCNVDAKATLRAAERMHDYRIVAPKRGRKKKR